MITPCNEPRASTWQPPHFLYAACLSVALSGCGAVGELARTSPWGWIATVVAVVVVAGFLAARMRR